MIRPSTAMIDLLGVDLGAERRRPCRRRSRGRRRSSPRRRVATRRRPRRGPSGAARPASGLGSGARPSPSNSGSVTGSPPSSARRSATSTSSGGRSSRLVSPKRSRNSKPVPYRNGRPGRVGAAQLDDEAAMQQRADGVVGVDAADALDGRLRDGLAVGDDGQGLEAGRRQPDRVRADVAGDERAALGGRRQLDPVAIDDQADAALAQGDLEVAEAGVDGLAVGAGQLRRSRAG